MIHSVKEFHGQPSRAAAKAQERAVIVFHLLPGLAYATRWAISLGLVAVGFLLQALTFNFWFGAIFLLAGSLLLCVKGYHNWVEGGRFRPDAGWENCELGKLDELVEFDRRMERWNYAFMDVTNGRGLLGLLLVLAPLVGVLLVNTIKDYEFIPREGLILAGNALVLLLPHWVTGCKRILRLPKLMVKVELLRRLLRKAESVLGNDRANLMMQLEPRSKQPADVKLRVEIDGSRKDFLGLYVQVVTNDVQGRSYPYLYAVVVTRQGYGLEKQAGLFTPPRKIICEYQQQDEVEILVIRQATTAQSGYHTNDKAAYRIFIAAFEFARQAALPAG